jgi:hypothetical protein
MLCRQNWMATFLAQSPASLLGVSAGITARGLWWPDREWLEIYGGWWLGYLVVSWSLAQGVLPHDLETSQWDSPGLVIGCCTTGLLLWLLLLLLLLSGKNFSLAHMLLQETTVVNRSGQSGTLTRYKMWNNIILQQYCSGVSLLPVKGLHLPFWNYEDHLVWYNV